MVLAFASIVISAVFEGGSVGKVEQIGPTHVRCAVKGQADQDNRNRQANWYFFKLTGLPQGKEVRIDLTDLVGEYNFRPGTHAVTPNTRPVFSYDASHWTHFSDGQVSWDEKEVMLTLKFVPAKPVMWISHMEPYTGKHLQSLLALRHPHAIRTAAGRTVRSREIPLITISDNSIAPNAKKVVWLMARQHAWEAGTSWAADGAVRFLLSDDEEASRIRKSTVFMVIPIFDVDGVAEGTVRFNLNGFDNNRNWDTAETRTMPEIFSVRDTLLKWLDAGRRIDVFLAMHNTESADYVEGAVEDERVRPVADALVAALRASTNFHDPKSPRNSMTASMDKGRYTVNQYLYSQRKAAAFLMELMVERHPALGRPRTAHDFSQFGAELAKCLARAAAR